MPPNNVKYHLLEKDAESDDESTSSHNFVPGKKTIALAVTVASASILLIVFLISGFPSPKQCPTMKPRQPWLPSCGHTPDAAIASGCIFDPMMNSWTHPECYDEELTNEFLALRDWKFYKDQNATIPLSDEEFSRAGDSWGTWEYHIAHCMFSFRKLHKALAHGGKIEKEAGGEGHSEHCLMVMNVTFSLMKEAETTGEHFSLQDMGTVLETGFHRCIDAINILPYDGVVTL